MFAFSLKRGLGSGFCRKRKKLKLANEGGMALENGFTFTKQATSERTGWKGGGENIRLGESARGVVVT